MGSENVYVDKTMNQLVLGGSCSGVGAKLVFSCEVKRQTGWRARNGGVGLGPDGQINRWIAGN